jgi:hypothetical protein
MMPSSRKSLSPLAPTLALSRYFLGNTQRSSLPVRCLKGAPWLAASGILANRERRMMTTIAATNTMHRS